MAEARGGGGTEQRRQRQVPDLKQSVKLGYHHLVTDGAYRRAGVAAHLSTFTLRDHLDLWRLLHAAGGRGPRPRPKS
jgi:hypothetical protein